MKHRRIVLSTVVLSCMILSSCMKDDAAVINYDPSLMQLTQEYLYQYPPIDPINGGKVYSTEHFLHGEELRDTAKLYLWVHSEEYKLTDTTGKIYEKGSGRSGPVVMTIAHRQEIVDYYTPRDGADYATDLEKLFSPKALEALHAFEEDLDAMEQLVTLNELAARDSLKQQAMIEAAAHRKRMDSIARTMIQDTTAAVFPTP